jgi:glycosyltransferase involved in cell wall biosynthesis
MFQSLARHHDMEWLDYSFSPTAELTQLADRAFHKIILRRRFSRPHTFLFARSAARAIETELKGRSLDLLFASMSSSSTAFLETPTPIIHHSDATFDLINNYHPAFVNLTARNVAQGEQIEKNALERARHVVLQTEWARRSVVDHYRIPESRTSVVSSGADLIHAPGRSELRWTKSGGSCKLLLVGRSWREKGGDIALKAMSLLNGMGLETTLTAVGCEPPSPVQDPNLTVIPLLDKASEDDMAKLCSLYRDADFLILPTRAECGALVYCEASAFGLPSITSETGGVAGHVESGVNGERLPYDDEGKGYAEVIRDLWKDEERYSSLRRSSREKYERELNWSAWGDRVSGVIEELGL